MAENTVREAVGVFFNEKDLHEAVDDLLVAGFDRSQLSLLAGHETVEEKLKGTYRKVRDLEDDPRVAYQAYVGTDSRTEAKSFTVGALAYVGAVAAAGMIVASGGTVAAAVIAAAAAGGAGGAVGAALSRYIDRRHAHWIQEQLGRGGILLWVRTPDDAHERRAVEALEKHSAGDVHVHDLPAMSFDFEHGESKDLSFMKRLGL